MAPGGDANDVVLPTTSQQFTTSTGTLTSPSSSSNPPAGDSLQVPPPPPTLPPELVEDILCRLPVKSLLRFRCVCKSWNSLISDPKFARKHLRKFTRHNLIVKFKNGLNSYPLRSPFITTRLEYPLNIDDCYEIVGSCDGILCCCAFPNHTFPIWVVWNPSIRKFMETPRIENLHKKWYVIHSHGFGYDHLTETYKVVVVLSDVECDKSQVMVHTLGCTSTSWRRLEIDFPYLPYDDSGKFVSGTINWMACAYSDSKLYVISLDLRIESCQELRLPGDIDDRNPTLAVLKDCLGALSHEREFWDIWVMEEHGNDESWTKLYRVLDHNGDVGYYPNQPIYISEDDDEVELPSFSNLVICSCGSISGKVFKIFDIQNSQVWMFPEIWEDGPTPEVYVESLISPCPQY